MTSYAWAVPGARCICVNGAWCWSSWSKWVSRLKSRLRGDRDPVKGERLIVAGVSMAPDGKVYLSFRGRSSHAWYVASAFRPLVTRTIEDDIAIFAPWLNTRELAQ